MGAANLLKAYHQSTNLTGPANVYKGIDRRVRSSVVNHVMNYQPIAYN